MLVHVEQRVKTYLAGRCSTACSSDPSYFISYNKVHNSISFPWFIQKATLPWDQLRIQDFSKLIWKTTRLMSSSIKCNYHAPSVRQVLKNVGPPQWDWEILKITFGTKVPKKIYKRGVRKFEIESRCALCVWIPAKTRHVILSKKLYKRKS